MHDLVLDYAHCMRSEEELRAAQRRLVNIIRERRPTSTYYKDRSGWERAQLEDSRLTKYVVLQLAHHVRHALQNKNGAWVAEPEICCWLDDYNMVQDAVPLACATILGEQKVEQLATLAGKQGNAWSAALRWSSLALVTSQTVGLKKASEHFKNCMESLLLVKPIGPDSQRKKDRLELSTALAIISMWNPVCPWNLGVLLLLLLASFNVFTFLDAVTVVRSIWKNTCRDWSKCGPQMWRGKTPSPSHKLFTAASTMSSISLHTVAMVRTCGSLPRVGSGTYVPWWNRRLPCQWVAFGGRSSWVRTSSPSTTFR